MPKFNIINNTNEIKLNNNWLDSEKFNSKDRIVDANGKSVASDYAGNRYRLITKKERNFSFFERTGRIFLGVLASLCTLGCALYFKPILKLFTKQKESIRFGVLEKQTKFKVEEGKIVYLEPELLYMGTKISKDQELNFALIKTDHKEKLIAITTAPDDNKCKIYEGSPFEALLMLAQNKAEPMFFGGGLHYGSPINHFLKHPSNSIINEEEFYKFLLEKDNKGTPRICTLNSESTLEVLTTIKEKNISINLHEKTSQDKTLFSHWVGRNKPKILELILELDPSVIEQIKDQKESAFVDAALEGHKKEAELLINAMENREMPLSDEEVWIKRAYKNDCEFSDEAFNQLSQALKLDIYFVANAFGSVELVKKLRDLGMYEDPITLTGKSIFASNMDIVTTRNTMERFLKELRIDGLLLTHNEFNQLDKNKYMSKVDQIGRIQGKNFIERLVKENGLKHIKVPKKIVVLDKGIETISFRLFQSLEMIPKSDQITIYAELVKPVQRKLSLEEAIEFMIILEKTGYNDFFGQNFFYCEDGIYFIDTEFKDFSPTKPKFGAIKSLKDCLEPKDVDKFLEEYEKRKKNYDDEKDAREAQMKAYKTAFSNFNKNLVGGYDTNYFSFPLNSLS
ncbi:MAG: hypothetical protein H0W88_06180 [Parachlamydiaceae bacterium]|nr:hypothetical protein [Parachlamydiaceae bacterium]